MAYEIIREDGLFGFNVLDREGNLVDCDFYFQDRGDAEFVVQTLYPGITELGE